MSVSRQKLAGGLLSVGVFQTVMPWRAFEGWSALLFFGRSLDPAVSALFTLQSAETAGFPDADSSQFTAPALQGGSAPIYLESDVVRSLWQLSANSVGPGGTFPSIQIEWGVWGALSR